MLNRCLIVYIISPFSVGSISKLESKFDNWIGPLSCRCSCIAFEVLGLMPLSTLQLHLLSTDCECRTTTQINFSKMLWRSDVKLAFKDFALPTPTYPVCVQLSFSQFKRKGSSRTNGITTNG